RPPLGATERRGAVVCGWIFDPVRRPGPQSEGSTATRRRAALCSLRSLAAALRVPLGAEISPWSALRHAALSHGEKRPVHRSTYRSAALGARLGGGPACRPSPCPH